MKPLIPILAVATTSLAVASVQFAQQASTQRKRADAEVQLRQKQEARVVELERVQAQLQSELTTMREQSAAAPPAAVVSTPPVAAASKPAAVRQPGFGGFAVAQVGPGGPPPPGVFEARGRSPFDSPAARNFMRSRMKNQIRRLYGDAGHALGLSAEKGNQLLDLLAEQQTMGFGMRPDQLPPGQTFQQYAQEQQKKNNDAINALIGADKADEWAAYQKTLPERSQLGAVADQLEQAGYPMSESQRTEMLAAISEESKRLPPRPSFQQGVPPEEMMAQMNQWQTEYDKALMDRARQVLNTDQFNAYKEYQDWQTEMRNNMPRGPNGGPGGVVLRSFSSSSNGLVAAPPTMNFQMAVPAEPIPAPAESRK
jgi:hypothetical protein